MSGIYIHVPFCHSKCAYCDFYSVATKHQYKNVVDAIIKEKRNRIEELSGRVNTIYIGGGTPSILLHDILEHLLQNFKFDNISEYTIEVNPEDVTRELIDLIRGNGVNRISMGVQSFCDEELKIIRRRHNAKQALSAIDTIVSNGIDNYSIDLIYGLPGQSIESWKYSLNKLFEIRPNHFSAYMLGYEEGTLLYRMRAEGRVIEADENTLAQMYKILIEEAARHGYVHYEISNFALPNYEAKHNSNYWNDTDYLGLGPAAHSYTAGVRKYNPMSIKLYLEQIENQGTAFEVDEENDNNRFNDMIITRLRTKKGIEVTQIPQKFREGLINAAMPYLESGDLRLVGDYMSIPEDRWLTSDAVMRELIVID